MEHEKTELNPTNVVKGDPIVGALAILKRTAEDPQKLDRVKKYYNVLKAELEAGDGLATGEMMILILSLVCGVDWRGQSGDNEASGYLGAAIAIMCGLPITVRGTDYWKDEADNIYIDTHQDGPAVVDSTQH